MAWAGDPIPITLENIASVTCGTDCPIDFVVPWTGDVNEDDSGVVLDEESSEIGTVFFGRMVGAANRMAHIRGVELGATTKVAGTLEPGSPDLPAWDAADPIELFPQDDGDIDPDDFPYEVITAGGTWKPTRLETIEDNDAKKTLRFYGRHPDVSAVNRYGGPFFMQWLLEFWPSHGVVGWTLLATASSQYRPTETADFDPVYLGPVMIRGPASHNIHMKWGPHRVGDSDSHVTSGYSVITAWRNTYGSSQVENQNLGAEQSWMGRGFLNISAGPTAGEWAARLQYTPRGQALPDAWDGVFLSFGTIPELHSSVTNEATAITNRWNDFQTLLSQYANRSIWFIQQGHWPPQIYPVGDAPTAEQLDYGIHRATACLAVTTGNPRWIEEMEMTLPFEWQRGGGARYHVGPGQPLRDDARAPRRTGVTLNDGQMVEYGDFPSGANGSLLGGYIDWQYSPHPEKLAYNADSRYQHWTATWREQSQSHVTKNTLLTYYAMTGDWAAYYKLKQNVEQWFHERMAYALPYSNYASLNEIRATRQDLVAAHFWTLEHDSDYRDKIVTRFLERMGLDDSGTFVAKSTGDPNILQTALDWFDATSGDFVPMKVEPWFSESKPYNTRFWELQISQGFYAVWKVLKASDPTYADSRTVMWFKAIFGALGTYVRYGMRKWTSKHPLYPQDNPTPSNPFYYTALLLKTPGMNNDGPEAGPDEETYTNPIYWYTGTPNENWRIRYARDEYFCRFCPWIIRAAIDMAQTQLDDEILGSTYNSLATSILTRATELQTWADAQYWTGERASVGRYATHLDDEVGENIWVTDYGKSTTGAKVLRPGYLEIWNDTYDPTIVGLSNWAIALDFVEYPGDGSLPGPDGAMCQTYAPTLTGEAPPNPPRPRGVSRARRHRLRLFRTYDEDE